MPPRLHTIFRAVVAAALLATVPQVPALAQDVDLEMRIQRLENQLRQLTGQNEELQYRNRQLAIERLAERLRGALKQRRRRRPTQPSRAAERERLDAKRRQGERKRARRRPSRDDW